MARLGQAMVHEEREASIDTEHYRPGSYDGLGRFLSYWHQIDEMRRARPANVLEIGVGNGFVARYLCRDGYDVTTLDVNPNLGADVLGSITAIPCGPDTFDMVTACEVIEHPPFSEVPGALREMARVTRSVVLLSVPDRTPALRLHVSVSGLRPLQAFIPFGIAAPARLLGRDHEWELGLPGYPLRRLVRTMRESGLRLQRSFRIFLNPTQRVFVLSR